MNLGEIIFLVFACAISMAAGACIGMDVEQTRWVKDCELVGQHRVNTTIYTCSKGATK